MSSGFGYKGGRPRCFAYWQDFQKCYAQADAPSDCAAAMDDYMECLHHKKEIARAEAIKDHWVQRQAKEAHQAREQGEVRATSSPLDLGLIRKPEKETKDTSSDSSSSE